MRISGGGSGSGCGVRVNLLVLIVSMVRSSSLSSTRAAHEREWSALLKCPIIRVL